MELTGCVKGIRFPDGADTGTTRGEKGRPPVRLRNARVARALDLSGMRVLDVGCSNGLYSLYMADSAKEVVGIDQIEQRIAVAESTRRKLGYTNVQFKVADIRDPRFLDELGSFDLVVAWGFLHRIPDIFSALYSLAQITNAFSLEWMTPIFPSMRRASVAFHPTETDLIDTTNLEPVGGLSADEMSGRKPGGKAGFWLPTPYAVETLLRKYGYRSARVLGYNEGLWPERMMILWHLARKARHPSAVTYGRVHMIAERTPGTLKFKPGDLRNALPPEWDVAAREYAQRRMKAGQRS